MPTNDSYAAKIIADAEALLGKVQRDLDDAAEFYRTSNIDPAKVLPALEPHMTANEKLALKRALDEDEAAIQREVDEGMARLNFATPSSGSAPKKPRSMV
jgi:hypothetical protein